MGRLEAALLRESASVGAEAGQQEPEQPAADAGAGGAVKADEVRGTLRSVPRTHHARVHTLCANPGKVRAGSACVSRACLCRATVRTWYVKHPILEDVAVERTL